MMKFKEIALNGLYRENPTFRLVLGMCPAMAVSTAALNGIGMGLTTTIVLVFSNALISLLRGFIPRRARIPAFIVIFASLVTIIEFFLKAYMPALSQSLGLYIPLIVVNCIIFARADGFAARNPVLISIADGLFMGLGFTLALTVVSIVRELLGNGSVFGVALPGLTAAPMLIMLMPPGGFIALGLVLVAFNALAKRIDSRREAA